MSEDRNLQIFNALKRLQGSYNLGPEVGISDGGEASFQDLVRVLSALQLHRVEHGSLQKGAALHHYPVASIVQQEFPIIVEQKI